MFIKKPQTSIKFAVSFYKRKMSNDPLHGLTLEQILTALHEKYGWEELANRIRINCFHENPSISSSLKFLRKTPWARKKVEDLYIYKIAKKKQP